MKAGKPEPLSLDAMMEEDDHIDIRTYPSPSGYTLAIDVNGRTIVRLGGIKREELPTEIVHEY